MNEQESGASGVNTVLIVILLLAVVAGGVWIAARGGFGEGKTDETRDINVDLSLPGGQEQGGGDTSGE